MTKQGRDSWKQAAQGEKKLAEYWESQAAAEKERADKAEERIRSLEYAENFALEQTKLVLEVEAREKKLREAIEQGMPDMLPTTRIIFKRVLASLYPEEGEAK